VDNHPPFLFADNALAVTAFAAAIAGVFGLAVGSFLNVVIHRVPQGLSLVRPPSSCPSCGTAIRSRDNIPVISYVLLRGKCRNCGAPISARYPLIELLTAALWVGAVVRFGPHEDAAFVALASAVLLAISAIDLEVRRIPNVIVLPATAATAVWVLGVAGATGRWEVAERALGTGAWIFAVLFLIALISGGMGFGDVKLGAFVGIVAGRFGWNVGLAALILSFVIGGLVAIGLLVARRKGRKDALPFGPYLAVGALAAVFLGPSPVRAWLGF
jgi:leader peptidase (prepilin peptidase)/N-methyltransferase